MSIPKGFKFRLWICKPCADKNEMLLRNGSEPRPNKSCTYCEDKNQKEIYSIADFMRVKK